MLLNHTSTVTPTGSQGHNRQEDLQADTLGATAATFQQLKAEILRAVIFHILLRWAEDEDLTLQLATLLQHVNL